MGGVPEIGGGGIDGDGVTLNAVLGSSRPDVESLMSDFVGLSGEGRRGGDVESIVDVE